MGAFSHAGHELDLGTWRLVCEGENELRVICVGEDVYIMRVDDAD